MDISEVALVLFSYESGDFIMIPEHENIFYVMARWNIYRALKYQLFSSIIIDLVNVMKENIFLCRFFCSYIRLEAARIISCGIINTNLLRLKT